MLNNILQNIAFKQPALEIAKTDISHNLISKIIICTKFFFNSHYLKDLISESKIFLDEKIDFKISVVWG